MKIEEALIQLNLGKKEAEAFLALVKLGGGTATAIAGESGITRTHVYDIMKELVEKGLVSEIEEKKIKRYEAVGHAGLLAFVSRQEKQLQTVQKELVKLASDFQGLEVGARQKTTVRFFDGVEGVKNIYAEIRNDLNKQKESFDLLTIFSPENLEKIIPNFQYLDYPNMDGRDIVADDKMLSAYIKQMKQSKNTTAYKIWPKEKGFFPTDNIAWGNKIAYIDLVTYPSGIIIESESIVQSFRMWFNVLWENLK